MGRATSVTALRPTAMSERRPANKEACGTIAVAAAKAAAVNRLTGLFDHG